MLRLRNNTGGANKVGYVVAVDPKDPKSFIYAPIGSTKAIGVTMESVPYRSICNIATIGERVDVYTQSTVIKGNVLRLNKISDNRSLGMAVVAKPTDAPYLRVGEALANGRGFIPIIVDFNYAFSGTSTIKWTDITGKPNEGIRFVTDDTIELSTDRTIVCDKATAMDVSLLEATGSGRVLEIANTGVGTVTVYAHNDPSDPSDMEVINDEISQLLYTSDCMVIRDIAINTWIII